jgi:hypothetical protein
MLRISCWLLYYVLHHIELWQSEHLKLLVFLRKSVVFNVMSLSLKLPFLLLSTSAFMLVTYLVFTSSTSAFTYDAPQQSQVINLFTVQKHMLTAKLNKYVSTAHAVGCFHVESHLWPSSKVTQNCS